ncbi:hypothetical protein LCL95_10055 [Bacillus timonensis]|nr:hypothetical protein [Bacillus timonensis]
MTFKDLSIPIPITSNMLLMLFKRVDVEGLSNFDVLIHDEKVCFRGTFKKMLLNIPFQIDLKPVGASERKLSFEICRMKPINVNWINEILFNRASGVSYHNSNVTIDLNEFDQIRNIPIGTIRDVEVKNDKIFVRIGL